MEVHCNVAGANVLIREKLVGTSPLPKALSVNAGSAKVDVVAEGYAPYHQENELPGGKTVPLSIVLAPLVKNGTLVVHVSGEPASVENRSRPFGDDPPSDGAARRAARHGRFTAPASRTKTPRR